MSLTMDLFINKNLMELMKVISYLRKESINITLSKIPKTLIIQNRKIIEKKIINLAIDSQENYNSELNKIVERKKKYDKESNKYKTLDKLHRNLEYERLKETKEIEILLEYLEEMKL